MRNAKYSFLQQTCDLLFFRSAKNNKSHKQLGTSSSDIENFTKQKQYQTKQFTVPTSVSANISQVRQYRILEIVLNAFDWHVFGNYHFRGIVSDFWFWEIPVLHSGLLKKSQTLMHSKKISVLFLAQESPFKAMQKSFDFFVKYSMGGDAVLWRYFFLF